MATLDDRLLGEKKHYYCSSSSEDEDDEKSKGGNDGGKKDKEPTNAGGNYRFRRNQLSGMAANVSFVVDFSNLQSPSNLNTFTRLDRRV